MIAKRGISGFEMYEYRDEFFGSNVYGRRMKPKAPFNDISGC